MGWHHLFRGHMSQEWGRAQDKAYREADVYGTGKNGRVWTSNVLHHLWESWFILWEARNAKVHGSEAYFSRRLGMHNLG